MEISKAEMASAAAAVPSQELMGSEILIKGLQAEGVKYIWGYPGGAVLYIYDALYKQDSIQHVLVRHEQAAVHAADGYARATGDVGVALVTSGPGLTNAVTGIATREGNLDDDGNASGVVSFISDEQVEELTALITETKTDIAKFLEIGKVESLSDITTADFGTAKALLLSKKKKDVSK